jgi:hypothetical protein
MRTLTSKRQQFRGIREGYRSGLEDLVAKQLTSLGIKFEYEPKDGKVEYTKPQSKHKYTPDFVFTEFIVETKGRFTTADRKKHKLIKEQHPDIDIRFVFSNSNTRISKQSRTTYAQWCEHYGFKYADKLIPNDWLREIKS